MKRTRYGSSNGQLHSYRTLGGGIATLLINRTGGLSVEGTLVEMSASHPMSFGVACANCKKHFGLVDEPGIPDGGFCGVTFKGVAKALLRDGDSASMGEVLAAAAIAGRVTPMGMSKPNPQSGDGDEIYQVVGVALENKTAGTDALCRVLLA